MEKLLCLCMARFLGVRENVGEQQLGKLGLNGDWPAGEWMVSLAYVGSGVAKNEGSWPAGMEMQMN